MTFGGTSGSLIGPGEYKVTVRNGDAETTYDVQIHDHPESTIPQAAHDEKQALSSHPEHSAKILEGRIPLGQTYLDIIGNHHSHSTIGPAYNQKEGTITGIETGLISAMDTISAMTSERPYRSRLTLYDSLDMVRSTMSAQYPQEFKFLF